MIYIGLQNREVTMTHFAPFHEEYGLKRTKEELEKTGIFVESLPEPEQIKGKDPILKYDATKGLYYEYVDRPLSPEEENAQLKAKIEKQEQEMATLSADLQGFMDFYFNQ
ncbi:hypothetical protein M3221_13455 [Domibacillus indicus]|uniref:hypothetical protein n=1 Tax=Domibacillus indicus TaxID=1437523 RepID=UPI00203BCCDB|nr:hypothetical protein [Domibacillus indicus]MCM3789407.1 hypothetical protein [Domibacillus indicus]